MFQPIEISENLTLYQKRHPIERKYLTLSEILHV